MVYTFLGTITLPIVSATVSHIPTIIISIVAGPVPGVIVGLSMGISSMIRAITQPTSLLSPFIANPAISVLPRALIGLAAYYSYAAVKKLVKNNTIATVAGTICGSAANTIFFLGMLYIIYAKELLERMQATDRSGTAISFIYGIVMTNGIAELVATAIISTIVILAIKKARII